MMAIYKIIFFIKNILLYIYEIVSHGGYYQIYIPSS